MCPRFCAILGVQEESWLRISATTYPPPPRPVGPWVESLAQIPYFGAKGLVHLHPKWLSPFTSENIHGSSCLASSQSLQYRAGLSFYQSHRMRLGLAVLNLIPLVSSEPQHLSIVSVVSSVRGQVLTYFLFDHLTLSY